MSNFWNDDDSVSELDMIAEQYEIDTESLIMADDEQLDEIAEESAFELDEDESNIVFNARLRLEMARLYEMLINHDIFDGVEASAHAIKKVQDEIKTYIVSRLEILLGIRKEKKVIQVQQESVFDEDEVSFLKQLAQKGISISNAKKTDSEPRVKPIQNTSAPVAKPKTLKNISNKPVSTQRVETKTQPTQQPIKRGKPPVQKAVTTTVKTSNKNKTVEEIAKEDLRELQAKKPFEKMSAKEKVEEIKRVNNKYARKKPNNIMPMMSPAQLEMHYTAQQQNSLMKDKDANLKSILISKLINEKQ